MSVPARQRLLPVLLLVVALGGGCAAPEPTSYGADRLLDLYDVVDLKYGCHWDSFGIGVKLEATNYLGAAVGAGRYTLIHEQFGRYQLDTPYEFIHLLIWGLDGQQTVNLPSADAEYLTLIFNCCQRKRPPFIDRFRFGGEVLVLGALGGLYLNLGELLDLFAGVVTLDPAGDDELPDGAAWW